jgi:hypothetical protein
MLDMFPSSCDGREAHTLPLTWIRTKDPVSETLCFLVIQNSERRIKSAIALILSVIHLRQNPLDFTAIAFKIVAVYFFLFLLLSVRFYSAAHLVKSILFLLFLWTTNSLRHEGVLANGYIDPPFLTSHWLQVNGQLHIPAALLWGKSHQYPFDRRLDGPRIGLEDVKKILTVTGNATLTPWPSSL